MLGSSPSMTAGKMAPPKCPPHPPGPDDILSDLAATHQEAPQGGKITRPQVILFPMVSEFARKFQKNHHSRSNLRNCALHKMSRTSKNQEKAAVCKDKTGGEALNSATFSHPPYAVATEPAEGQQLGQASCREGG